MPKSLAEALTAPKSSADTAEHVIVRALAGTGKTTTLVEGLKIVKGLKSPLIPSEQQKAVWDAMAKSKGAAKTVCFCAFNRSIKEELARRVPTGCEALTMHGLGLRAVTKGLGKQDANKADYVVQDIIADLLEVSSRDLRAKDFQLLQATEKLVSLCKLNLVGFEEDFGDDDWADALDGLCDHYDIDLNGSRERVYDLVPRVLDRCKAPKGRINFDDMIWLPVVLNLPVFKYDLLLVDEAQDLNRCQQALAMRAGSRLILCGDPNQAIYGFAGADSESMDRMTDVLMATPRGVTVLPLTVTRRCGKAIVAEAQEIVKDFEAHESNGAGKVSHRGFGKPGGAKTVEQDASDYRSWAADGDMIVCRVNAPLVSECFRFIKAGRKATIAGRDIGQGLITTVKKIGAPDIDTLELGLTAWLEKETEKEQKKARPSEARLIGLQDRFDCLMCFVENSNSPEEVISRIEAMFSDKDTKGLRLSSIHKAKGLESDRVFLLEPDSATVPHPMAKGAWQIGQEWNLRYVAITRAIKELVYVTGSTKAEA